MLGINGGKRKSAREKEKSGRKKISKSAVEPRNHSISKAGAIRRRYWKLGSSDCPNTGHNIFCRICICISSLVPPLPLHPAHPIHRPPPPHRSFHSVCPLLPEPSPAAAGLPCHWGLEYQISSLDPHPRTPPARPHYGRKIPPWEEPAMITRLQWAGENRSPLIRPCLTSMRQGDRHIYMFVHLPCPTYPLPPPPLSHSLLRNLQKFLLLPRRTPH